jgi:hypothetical protein
MNLEACPDWKMAIRQAVLAGNAALKRCHRAALDSHPSITRSRLLIMPVDACSELGRGKQVRTWLETLLRHGDVPDAIDALRSAVESRHTDLVLKFFEQAMKDDLPDPERCLKVAEKMLHLAESLRLPRRHPSVWKAHMALLNAAVRLLARIEPSLKPEFHDAGGALLARALRLLRSEMPSSRAKGKKGHPSGKGQMTTRKGFR